MSGPPVRVLLDVNILISYLLHSSGSRAIGLVVEAALAGAFTLLIPDKLLEEFVQRVATKEYLARRIGRADLASLVENLLQVAERLAPIPGPLPAVVRDPKDDYLLAYALAGGADYLVTGDRDLLALGEVAELKVISPADFVHELQLEG